MSYGHIYLIKAIGTTRYKIGLTTRDVETRFKEINSSQSAYPLELMGSIYVANVKDVEKELHQKFSSYRVHGEWFIFKDNEIQEVMNIIDSYENASYTRDYQPQHSYAGYDDSNGSLIWVLVVGTFLAVGSFLNAGVKPEFNEATANSQEKELRQNFLACTDGKAGNDKHLNCQNIVIEYQSKFKISD